MRKILLKFALGLFFSGFFYSKHSVEASCFNRLSRVFTEPLTQVEIDRYASRSLALLEKSAVVVVEEKLGKGKFKESKNGSIDWEFVTSAYRKKEIGPWRLSLYPDVSLQKLALFGDPTLRDLNLPGGNLWNVLESWMDQPLVQILKTENLTELALSKLLPNFRATTQVALPLQESDKQKALKSIFWASLWANPRDPLLTSAATNRIVEMAGPQTFRGSKKTLGEGHNFISFKNLYEEFLSNPEAWMGLKKAAKKIFSRLNRTLPMEEGDLFSDLLESYLDAGIGPQRALELTWDLLALISTKGTGVGTALVAWTNPSANPLGALLSVVTHGANILDTNRWQLNRGNYSFPRNVKINFVTGKSYHFWMMAYLARKMTQENHGNARVGFASAWLTELGYQFASRTVGRNPERAFVEHPKFGDHHFRVRMDLALAAAGGAFGTNFNTPIFQNIQNTLDVDKALQVLEIQGKNLPPMDLEAAKIFLEKHPLKSKYRWIQIFSPQAAAHFFGF